MTYSISTWRPWGPRVLPRGKCLCRLPTSSCRGQRRLTGAIQSRTCTGSGHSLLVDNGATEGLTAVLEGADASMTNREWPCIEHLRQWDSTAAAWPIGSSRNEAKASKGVKPLLQVA